MKQTNKQRWHKLGFVDYIAIIASPPKILDPGDLRNRVLIDFTPEKFYGACDAFQALIKAITINKTPDKAKRFYTALKEFSIQWSGDN